MAPKIADLTSIASNSAVLAWAQTVGAVTALAASGRAYRGHRYPGVAPPGR